MSERFIEMIVFNSHIEVLVLSFCITYIVCINYIVCVTCILLAPSILFASPIGFSSPTLFILHIFVYYRHFLQINCFTGIVKWRLYLKSLNQCRVCKAVISDFIQSFLLARSPL